VCTFVITLLVGEEEIGRIMIYCQVGQKFILSTKRLGAVIHVYNLSYTGGIGRKFVVQGQPQEKT
jgi:hypothetical protein